MKKVLAAVLMVLACCAAYAETDYTVERKVDYLWRHVVGSGGGGGGDYPTKGWVTDKISAEAQARSAGDATVSGQVSVLSGSVNNISNRVVALESASGDYVTEADVYGIIKDMITDGGIVIGDYEYKLVVETVRNLADTVFKFADGSVIITNIVGAAPSYAGNTDLVSVEFGNKVTSIPMGGYQNCTGLTNLYLPNTITSLGRANTFNNTRITTVTLPTSLTSVPGGCFMNCTALKTAVFPSNFNSPQTVGSGVFGDNCTSLREVTFEGMTKSQVQTGNTQFLWFHGLHNVTVHCTDGDLSL